MTPYALALRTIDILLPPQTAIRDDQHERLLSFVFLIWLCIPTALGFGLNALRQGNTALFAMIMVTPGMQLFGWQLLRRGVSLEALFRANFWLYGLLLLYMVVHAGVESSRTLWLYTCPLIAFAILPRREALLSCLGILVLAMGFMVNARSPDGHTLHAADFLIRFAAVYLIVSAATGAFNWLRQRYWQEARDRQLALVRSEHLFSTIFDNSPDPLAISERASGRIIEVNEAFSRVLGYEKREVLNRTSTELQLWSGGHTRQRVLALMGEGVRLQNHEVSLRRKNGEEFPALLSVEAIELDGLVCLILTARDISERVRAEQALAEYRQHLEDMVRERTAELEAARHEAIAGSLAKSAFLSNMSHEIRTPMNAIIGLSHLLEKSATTDEQRERLAKIHGAADHLLAIINNILDLSKIEAGRVELENAPFRVADLAASIEAMVAPTVQQKGLRLIVDLAPLPEVLIGDRTRITQMLLNYVANAVKFTERGSVTLSGEVAEHAGDERLVRFTVADTGMGIPPARQARLFCAFEQADSSMTRRFGGTGLGLAVNRHLARLMGGEVGLDSEEGRGSRFWVTLRVRCPRAGDRTPEGGGFVATPDALEILRRDFAGVRLLLAEDEPINQEIALELLQGEAGLTVDVANNGHEAVALARRHPYALVLMDMQMPDMDGIEATLALRELPGHAETPIVAVTANAFDEDGHRCRAAGMNDHVGKPVDPAELFRVVLRWLRERAGASGQ